MASAISIHVPREGHDFVGDVDFTALNDISIHVPREGHDVWALYTDVNSKGFQSTCPARGTTRGCILNAISQGISIHVPREGHDAVTTGDFARMAIISIHVPREGHDHCRVKRRMSRE